jgi:hypothetical protein
VAADDRVRLFFVIASGGDFVADFGFMTDLGFVADLDLDLVVDAR